VNRIVFVILGISLSGIAFAKPIYLECDVHSYEKQQIFTVKVDEDSGKVTHSQPDGFAFNADGFFSADKITYQKIEVNSGIKITLRIEISRTDLSATYVTDLVSIQFPNQISNSGTPMVGACKIDEVTERKF